jgi:hypothetical protein
MADSSFPVSGGGGRWQSMLTQLQTLENANPGKGDKHVRGDTANPTSTSGTSLYVHGDQTHGLGSRQPKYQAGVTQIKAALDHDFGQGFGDRAFKALGKAKGFFSISPEKGLKMKDVAQLDQIVRNLRAADLQAAAPQPAPPPGRGGRIDLSAYPVEDIESNSRMMQDILAGTDPVLTQAFDKHCQGQLVGDELGFLREVQAFKQSPSLDEAQRLHDTYVASSGGCSLNLDGGERDEVEAAMGRLRGGGQVPGDLFDGPFGTVANQMVLDQVGKFRAHNS